MFRLLADTFQALSKTVFVQHTSETGMGFFVFNVWMKIALTKQSSLLTNMNETEHVLDSHDKKTTNKFHKLHKSSHCNALLSSPESCIQASIAESLKTSSKYTP